MVWSTKVKQNIESMPKKHRQSNLFTVKPQSSAPTAFRHQAPARVINQSVVVGDEATHQENDAAAFSVNALIARHRQDTNQLGPAALVLAAQNAQVQASATLHPAVQAVLSIPQLEAPAPRDGHRSTLRMRRMTPGPAPPRSWLAHSRHAQGYGPSLWCTDSTLSYRAPMDAVPLPALFVPRAGWLMHLALKVTASLWHSLSEERRGESACLPVHAKEALLSYFSVYGDENPARALAALFPSGGMPEDDETTHDHLNANSLDLANSIQESFTLKQVARRIFTGNSQTVARQHQPTQSKAIPDSWDAVSDSESDSEAPFPAPPTTSSPTPRTPSLKLRFPHLLHLSLALRLETRSLGSWADLISIAPFLSTLQSLSLAHWPKPTYTPRAAKTRAKVSNPLSAAIPAAIYGGTNMYSESDDDWVEAAGILKSLSRSTYCLKSLDLSGCLDWVEALTWRAAASDHNQIETAGLGDETAGPPPPPAASDDPSLLLPPPPTPPIPSPPPRIEPDYTRRPTDPLFPNPPNHSFAPHWLTTWRDITTLYLHVGWTVPLANHDTTTITSDRRSRSHPPLSPPSGQAPVPRKNPLALAGQHVPREGPLSDVDRFYLDRARGEFERLRKDARRAARRIRAIRDRGGGGWIEIRGD